jgi:RimJ/RimL family protein N-acetyltransferase
MPETHAILMDWKPVPLPQREPMHGRTVTLEPLDASRHAAALWNAVQGHDEVWQWLFDGPYVTEADLTAAIDRKQADDNQIFYAIIPTASGHAADEPVPPPGDSNQRVVPAQPQTYPSARGALGYASYLRMEPAHGVIEVGNILLSPSLQRTTAATEAMYLMARRVFDDLGYRRYEWKCNALNAPSRRAAQRLGFTFEGIFRQHMVIKGRNRDTAWFSILDQEWPVRKQAFESWLDPANFNETGQQRLTLEQCSPGA